MEASEPGKYDEYDRIYKIEDIELVYPGIREVVKRGDIFEDISVAENYRGNAQFFFDGEKNYPPPKKKIFNYDNDRKKIPAQYLPEDVECEDMREISLSILITMIHTEHSTLMERN